jgi:hypothetical protein
MATDFLTLGALVFDSWSTPHQMPFGGRQELAVHQLPGGARVVDTLGPSEHDIIFSAQMYRSDAIGVAEQLDAMRLSGAQVPLSFAGRFYLVIVAETKMDIERYPQLILYTVRCLVVQNTMAGVLGAIPSTVSQLVAADLSTAMSIAGL